MSDDAERNHYIECEKERIALKERVQSLEALLRWGVRMVRKPGHEKERQRWISDVSAAMPDGKVE